MNVLNLLLLINDALTSAVERATFDGDTRDIAFMAFVNQECAFRFLQEVLSPAHAHSIGNIIPLVFSGGLAPLHKWLQMIYLTDGGAIPVRAGHLSKVLDVPFATASAMWQTLALFRTRCY